MNFTKWQLARIWAAIAISLPFVVASVALTTARRRVWAANIYRRHGNGITR